jgi:hypothetical protein
MKAIFLIVSLSNVMSFRTAPTAVCKSCHNRMHTLQDDIDIQRNHESKLVEKLVAMKIKYRENTEARSLWAKDVVEIKSRQFIELLRNLVLSCLVVSTHITEDFQYFVTWASFGAATKKYKGWTPHMAIVGMEQATEGQTESVKSQFIIAWATFLTLIGKKANESLDMAYLCQDDINYFVDATKHSNGKIEGWTPSYTIKESMKKRQVSLQEVFNAEVLTFSTSIGNISLMPCHSYLTGLDDINKHVLKFAIVLESND